MSTRMLLQRMLTPQGGWATVVSFGPTDAPRVQAAAELMSQTSEVMWRVVRDSALLQTIAIFDGKHWRSVDDDMPAADDMPWWQSGVRTATDWVRQRRPANQFQKTIPTDYQDPP